MRSLLSTTLVFPGGFIIMVLEIVGARFLAKDFGSSFYVWTSQIGVILIALAAGYYIGGTLADRQGGLSLLTWLLVPAGAITLQVAREYFFFQDSPSNKVSISDGRVYLRRADKTYDAIILDAYVKSRYGSFIPYHLATEEFFKLANEHLSADGILAYNVIGSFQGWRADILGAVYRTMKNVFPQVYLFPATDSINVVLVATRSKTKLMPLAAYGKATDLVRRGVVQMPNFVARVRALQTEPPQSFLRSPVLTDDYAPVDGLLRGRN